MNVSNHLTSLGAAMTLPFHIVDHSFGASEFNRSASQLCVVRSYSLAVGC
jgi:hypothetical protein